jgi:WD40 repeat protein
LKGHDKEICDLDLHPTQSLAVSLSRGEKAIVWNVEEGEDVDSFMCQSKRGAEYWTRSCRFSPAVASDNDDDVVLHTIAVPLKRGRSSSLSSYLVQREVEEWSVTKTRAVTKEMLSALCVSRDGRLVAVGTAGGSVLVYSHDYQLLVKAPDVHSFSVTSLAVCSLSSGHGQTKPKRISNRKAVVSVSIDRTCCVTMVTKRKSTGTFSSLFCFAIIVLLLLTIWSLLYF